MLASYFKHVTTGALSNCAVALLDVASEGSEISAATEHFSGAELAGLVRSAGSFALARTVTAPNDPLAGIVSARDFRKALRECRPALGRNDEALLRRFPLGVGPHSPAFARLLRDLHRFTLPPPPGKPSMGPGLHSVILVAGGEGAGVTALAAWAAHQASIKGDVEVCKDTHH